VVREDVEWSVGESGDQPVQAARGGEARGGAIFVVAVGLLLANGVLDNKIRDAGCQTQAHWKEHVVSRTVMKKITCRQPDA
jgi:hypothetical protein